MTKLKITKTFIIRPRTTIRNKRTEIDKSKENRTNVHFLWKREKRKEKKRGKKRPSIKNQP
jgi:hypothetical protein